MIATQTEIKTLLQITAVTWDSLINTLIPIVTADLHEITSNDFASEVYAESDGLTFAASGGTITTDASADFDYLHLASGDDILVSGSLRNDGFYPVTSKSSTVITITSPFSVVNETPPSNDPRLITITKVNFPKGLKFPFSRMVGFHIQKNEEITRGVASESIGRHSVSYNLGGKGYPAFIIDALRPYMMAGCK